MFPFKDYDLEFTKKTNKSQEGWLTYQGKHIARFSKHTNSMWVQVWKSEKHFDRLQTTYNEIGVPVKEIDNVFKQAVIDLLRAKKFLANQARLWRKNTEENKLPVYVYPEVGVGEDGKSKIFFRTTNYKDTIKHLKYSFIHKIW